MTSHLHFCGAKHGIELHGRKLHDKLCGNLDNLQLFSDGHKENGSSCSGKTDLRYFRNSVTFKEISNSETTVNLQVNNSY